jgi:hypothetical protein
MAASYKPRTGDRFVFMGVQGQSVGDRGIEFTVDHLKMDGRLALTTSATTDLIFVPYRDFLAMVESGIVKRWTSW